jgi:glycosyltransferase involved in cell wall biosynthesis
MLGKLHRVPVLITEQAPWGPWLDTAALVRRQAVWAARQASFQIAISRSVKESIEHVTGRLEHLEIIPDAVDGRAFTLPPNGGARVRDRILFVGAVRPVKGLDVLIEAVSDLRRQGREVELDVIGEGHFEVYRREQARLQQLTVELGLGESVRFLGRKPLPELVSAMQQASALVLPSRAESLGMVLVEALACGTPVVATRCGGPEDIVTDGVGVLVPPENPSALADGILSVLDHPDRYESARLREHALARFGADVVAERILDLYRRALASPERGTAR